MRHAFTYTRRAVLGLAVSALTAKAASFAVAIPVKAKGVVIPPRFAYALDFFDGLAAVQWGEKWGYIDSSGEFAISPRFEMAESFSD